MTLPKTDPPAEGPEERLPKDSAALRADRTSGTGFRVEPRKEVPARTVLAPRTGLAARTDLSARTPSEPRPARPAGSPDPDGAGEDPATAP